MSRTRADAGWRASLRRRLGLDTNPVRRRIDRAEAWIRIGLVLAFLATAPVTVIGLARWTGGRMDSQAVAEAAHKFPVRATLLTDAGATTRYPGTGMGESSAAARWTAPDGARRTGTVDVPAGTRSGSRILGWTNAAGWLQPAPIARPQITSRVITVAGLGAVAVTLLFLTAAGVVRRVLDRRRMRAWEAGWTAVEPQWTRRLP